MGFIWLRIQSLELHSCQSFLSCPEPNFPSLQHPRVAGVASLLRRCQSLTVSCFLRDLGVLVVLLLFCFVVWFVFAVVAFLSFCLLVVWLFLCCFCFSFVFVCLESLTEELEKSTLLWFRHCCPDAAQDPLALRPRLKLLVPSPATLTVGWVTGIFRHVQWYYVAFISWHANLWPPRK